jgi:hypothetical protein
MVAARPILVAKIKSSATGKWRANVVGDRVTDIHGAYPERLSAQKGIGLFA